MTRNKQNTNSPVLCTTPNMHAREAGVNLYPWGAVIHGYQEYAVSKYYCRPVARDETLARKQAVLGSVFAPQHFHSRTVLDLGSNGGFYSLWALANGATRATAVDMDDAYVELIAQVTGHLGIGAIGSVKGNAADWTEPEDIVVALALVHWLYSCTASFGSLSKVIDFLASLTKYMLLVEWVAPEDPAIEIFRHTEWNQECVSEPYTTEAFERALDARFVRWERIGSVSDTRSMYLCFKTANEIDLSCPLPSILPEAQMASSRLLVTFDGIEYWSRVYLNSDGNSVIKQTTLDLAEREFSFLSTLKSDYFPRAVSTASFPRYSVVEIEMVAGVPLAHYIKQRSRGQFAEPARLVEFASCCLEILQQLRNQGIVHRDIRSDNLLVRDGKPVLIDFGWASSTEAPASSPPGLGRDGRPRDGAFSDTYAMGMVLSELNDHQSQTLDMIVDLMINENPSFRIEDPRLLLAMLERLETE